MLDLPGGKFELRMWLGILLIFTTLILTISGDQATFVHLPQDNYQKVLTIVPTLLYSCLGDRTTCFILTFSSYAAAQGLLGYTALIFLEQNIFEPLYFKRMIQTKLREEKLFNRFMKRYKS